MTLKVRLETLVFFSGIVLLGFMGAAIASGSPVQPGHRITGIEWQQTADAFLLTIASDGPPTYTVYQLPDPLRLVLDVAEAGLSETAGLPLKPSQGPVREITGRMLDDQEPFITRLELLLSEDQVYTAERVNNSIVLKFSSSAASPKKAPAAIVALVMNDVVVSRAQGETRVLLQANRAIEKYRRAELPAGEDQPDRFYIDIPDIRMAGSFKVVPVGSALAKVRVAQRGTGLRAGFDSGLEGPRDFRIQSVPEGLLVTIAESSPEADLLASLIGRGAHSTSKQADPADREVIEPQFMTVPGIKPETVARNPEAPATAAPRSSTHSSPPPAGAAVLVDQNIQKISVDFFKIDLHNVFRLIGEISGRNIVVDEGVSGTLTLALADVPWDFVLDVILNLKGLQKEERYNTIVISPKSKEFQWPKRAVDQLAVKADGITQKETITIKQRLETPAEVIEAKKLIHQGNEKYRAGDFAGALPLYEQAFAKWPENRQLAGQIAAMALVHLGKNAKAVHYAKIVLNLDPLAAEAALHAAIGLANMKRTTEAKSYFDRAIGTSRPSSEALLSYAAFCEENDSFQAALTLLAKHEQVHGNSLESMLARARIYDRLGRMDAAKDEYQAMLLSGFEIPADLKRYISGRVELSRR